jgi:hypothetical protein
MAVRKTQKRSRGRRRKTYRGGVKHSGFYNNVNEAETLSGMKRDPMPEFLSTPSQIAYIHGLGDKLEVLLEPFIKETKAAGKSRKERIAEYMPLLHHYQAQFLRDLRIQRVSKLEDIYPAVEEVYRVLFRIFNSENPVEEVKKYHTMHLVQTLIYAQEISKYSQRFV